MPGDVAKRSLDIVLSAAALIVLLPVLLAAAVAVRLSSEGPVFYRANRVGVGGRPFTMLKFRTMHVNHGGHVITAQNDPRVFPVGAVLRKTKIDELPQLLNVLVGQMSIVGPRPEDPKIVDEHYTELQRETLNVRPGLSSPGSLYYYAYGEQLLDTDDPERAYVERLLSVKLALDLVYVREASLAYDVNVILRTIVVLVQIVFGKDDFPEPPELARAREVYGFL